MNSGERVQTELALLLKLPVYLYIVLFSPNFLMRTIWTSPFHFVLRVDPRERLVKNEGTKITLVFLVHCTRINEVILLHCNMITEVILVP